MYMYMYMYMYTARLSSIGRTNARQSKPTRLQTEGSDVLRKKGSASVGNHLSNTTLV